MDGVAVRSVLFCGCGCGYGCMTAQHSTAQHFGVGTMLQFPKRRSQDESRSNSIVYEVER